VGSSTLAVVINLLLIDGVLNNRSRALVVCCPYGAGRIPFTDPEFNDPSICAVGRLRSFIALTLQRAWIKDITLRNASSAMCQWTKPLARQGACGTARAIINTGSSGWKRPVLKMRG
jgi:hypothetical protein